MLDPMLDRETLLGPIPMEILSHIFFFFFFFSQRSPRPLRSESSFLLLF